MPCKNVSNRSHAWKIRRTCLCQPKKHDISSYKCKRNKNVIFRSLTRRNSWKSEETILNRLLMDSSNSVVCYQTYKLSCNFYFIVFVSQRFTVIYLLKPCRLTKQECNCCPPKRSVIRSLLVLAPTTTKKKKRTLKQIIKQLLIFFSAFFSNVHNVTLLVLVSSLNIG